jgi:hypothetical protein
MSLRPRNFTSGRKIAHNRRMQKMIFVFLFALSGSLWAEPCAVVIPFQSDRLEKIQFPDGRQIYMLGHIHGDRELPFKMAELVRSRAKNLTSAALNTEISELEERASWALAEENVDLGQLRDLLSKQSNLQFVGFETEDRFAVSNLENYRAMLKDFQAIVRERAPEALSAAANLERIVLGAAGTLRLNEPRLFANREIRGFESANRTAASEKATLASEKALDKLRALAKGDQEFMQNVNGTIMQLDELYGSYSVAQDRALIQQMQNVRMPDRYRAATMEWFRLKLAEMAADKSREQDVVTNILAANASGILIMGSAHISGIMSELRKQCVVQTTASLTPRLEATTVN